MAAEHFPLFKLATQIARQLSSPVASRIKVYAKSHPRFSIAVCERVAIIYHEAEWRARITALRLAGTASPALVASRAPPMPRRQALELGGDLIGEIVIFFIGSMIVIFEVNRQAAIKEAKALEHKSEWLCVKLSLEEVQREVQAQQVDLNRLHAALKALYEPNPPAPSSPNT
ncbi:unnamed protein product [Pieris macdunnoughi]|uniref:Optic atrophy 3 protein n=1 Tax=Pieris macdunnoughi TaxID=345717 RepID=A0A821T930_9NEOP|nr:unnamed protein product [Pieris macdunnoughi]